MICDIIWLFCSTYLRNEVYAYLQSHTDLLPKAVVLVGVFRPESSYAEDDSAATLPSASSSDAPSALSVSGSGEDSQSSARETQMGTSGAEEGYLSEQAEMDDSAERRCISSANGSLAGKVGGSDGSSTDDSSLQNPAAELETQGSEDEQMTDSPTNSSQESVGSVGGENLDGAIGSNSPSSQNLLSRSEASEASTRLGASDNGLPQSEYCSSADNGASDFELRRGPSSVNGGEDLSEADGQGSGPPGNWSSGEGNVMDSRDGYTYLSEAENGCERTSGTAESAGSTADETGFRSGDVLVGTVELSFSPSTRTAALTLNPPAVSAFVAIVRWVGGRIAARHAGM